MVYEIELSPISKEKLRNFNYSAKRKVRRFMNAFNEGGFNAIDNHIICAYRVRNKKSDDVDTNDYNFVEKVQFATTHMLWHYHSGFYNLNNEYPIDDGYKLSNNKDLVSQWLIHYQKISDNSIFIADLAAHPPMDILSIQPKTL